MEQLYKRKATSADVPFLLTLRRETMEQHLAASGADISEDAHEARVMYQFECAQILTLKNTPVGLLKLRQSPEEWEIIQIQLSPMLHGKGFGRVILEQIIAEALTAGVSLKLSVLKENPAKRLYERLGFAVVGEDAHEFYMRRAF